MDFKKYSRRYIVLKALQGSMLGWSSATYAFFLLQHGYQLHHLTMVNMVFMSLGSVIDPWTGKLADMVGQKKVFLFGIVFWGLGTFTYFLANNLPGFMLAESIAALAYALNSQSLESWLQNLFPERAQELPVVRARAGWASKIGIIPAAIAGSLIGSQYGFEWPWLMEAISALVLLGVAIVMLRNLTESYNHSESEKVSVIEAVKVTAHNKALRLSTLFVFVTFFTFQSFNMFWSEIFRQASSGSSWWQGFVWIGIAIAIAIGSYASGKAKVVSGQHLALIAGSSGLAMLFASALNSNVLLLVLFFVLHEIPRGAIENVMFTYSNTHIKPHNRSTMNSVRSGAGRLGGAFGLAVFGALLFFEITDPIGTWVISSIILLVLASWMKLRA